MLWLILVASSCLPSIAYVSTKGRSFPEGANFCSACFCYLHIQVERGDAESEQAIFSVPDYTGNACKSVGMVHHVKQSLVYPYLKSASSFVVFG